MLLFQSHPKANLLLLVVKIFDVRICMIVDFHVSCHCHVNVRKPTRWVHDFPSVLWISRNLTKKMIKMAFCEEVRLTSGDVGYEETVDVSSSSNGNLIITRDAIFQLFNLVHEKIPFVSGGVCKSGFGCPNLRT